MDCSRFKYIIYALVDPRTLEWRYVGKSSSGLRRPRQHMLNSSLNKEDSHKNRWLKSLINKKLKPQVLILEELPTIDLLDQAEVEWISESKRQGHKLTNWTEGGELRLSRENLISIAQKRGLSPIWDSDGNKFELISDAAEYHRIPHQNIRAVIMGKYHFLKNKTISFTLNENLANKQLLTLMKDREYLTRSKGLSGRVVSEAARIQASKSKGSKPFIDQFGNKYNTLSEGSSVCNSHPSSVLRCLKRKSNSVRGYVFSWL